MGLNIEVNTVLALRKHGHPEYPEVQCVPAPQDLKLGAEALSFNKSGYRVYNLNKSLPLVVTQGGEQFNRVVGLVVITSITHEVVTILNKDGEVEDHIETSGYYNIVALFDETESNKWLRFLKPALSIQQ